ncbi:hypothetical protein [Fodinicurvata sediminis]|uniref:hypothetical protein n=1 Tax=Fodinicurvata sediminis TaxID=1121832 RepID=UPI0003B75A46|nr:hypothetical protein [Fodinicurvata sediminis]
MSYNLWKLFGLQRSGNHPIINWLMGLDQENTLFFNRRKPGVDLFDDPSGVSMPEGHKSYAIRVDGKKQLNEDLVDEFKRRSTRRNLLVSFENYDLRKFDEDLLDKPIVEHFGTPQSRTNFIVLRNPFNMLASKEKMLRAGMKKRRRKKMSLLQRIRTRDDDFIERSLNGRLSLWSGYAFLALYPNSATRGSFVPIVFDRWAEDRAYRDQIVESIGYRNRDAHLDFVSDAGKGSSFEGTEMKNTRNTLSRWDQGNKEICRRVIRRHPEVVDYASLIFGSEAIPKDI